MAAGIEDRLEILDVEHQPVQSTVTLSITCIKESF
jgi:hypothetical protein